MSHFSVLVMCKDKSEDLEKIMAPFDENMRVPVYIRYTKEQLIENKRKEIEHYKNTTYAEYLKNPTAYVEKHKGNPGHLDYVEKIFPKKLEYTDDECYQEAIEYYEPEEIDENGNVLSEYNPQSKWDWYQVGGRFQYLAREKKTGVLVNEGYAQDLDFSEDNDSYKTAIRFWELVVEGVEPETERDKRLMSGWIFKKEYYLERYGTKEWYAKMCSNFTSYAVVKPDGTWCSSGEMGWFGVSYSDNEREQKWDREYEKILKEAIENNYYLILVDCHI